MSQPGKLEESIVLDDDPLWYKDAVIYELHVRAFRDSNADGIGDFRGLVEKLDYLQDLGVTALWLLPFYPSPLRDDGYDIADYTSVNPIYGNLEDAKLFLREAHRRGLRVITELVLNHTSDQHPWFQRARRAPPGSPERDFYIWSDTPEKYQDARIIFKDFEPSNWSWDPVAKAYFWHRFYAHQPDLNYDSPAVRQAMFGLLDFWLDLGIDGVRLDAVPYLFEREGTNCENLPETHAYLKEVRRHIDEKYKNRMLLAEANQWPEDSAAYFGNGDECHMAFHFPVMPRLFMALRMEDRFPILDIMHQTPAIPDACQWAVFLRNHDELTLEMVTDEDRDYMYRVYAQDRQARINLGIRRRLAPLLENHRAKMELMNALLFSLPGTPVLYYGDEIGMGDNIYLGDRNGVRTPMQWSADRNAGFSQTNPQRLYFPVIIDPAYHYEAVNVEAQQQDTHSLLWWMKHLIALRKRYRAFGRGTLEFLSPDNNKVLAFIRRYDDEILLVVANLSRFVQYAELDLSRFQGMEPVELLGRTRFPLLGADPYFLTLGSHAFYWFLLRTQPAPSLVPPTGESELPLLQVRGTWERIFQGKARESLDDFVLTYLGTCPWFAQAGRTVKSCTIGEQVPVANGTAAAHVCLVQVEFTEGEPQTYLVPLAYAVGKEAEEVRAHLRQALVARVRLAGTPENEEGLLYDAVAAKGFVSSMVDAVAERARFHGPDYEIAAWPEVDSFGPPGQGWPEPAILRNEEADTAVGFGDRLVLKFFRRLEPGINPELEIGRFFARRNVFPNHPPLVGAIEYRRAGEEPMTLAVLQSFVPNEGTAWDYTLDDLGRYFERALTLKVAAEELPLPARPGLALVDQPLPPQVEEAIGSYLAFAGRLGQRTGEFHVALASATDDPSFAPEPFTLMYQRSLYQSLRTQARRTYELLRKRMKNLPEAERALAQKVLEHEEDVLRRMRLIYERKIGAQRTRYHGDYHLGQVLNTGKDVVILDWEGDAGRPMSDRRVKRTPLRDVAGMLRSFHFATHKALHKGHLRPEDIPVLEPWARLWYVWASVAFLKAYLAAAGAASFLPKSREELEILLDLSLTKRAVNDLYRDLKEHGDHIMVPLRALVRLYEARV
jgi:maltose alpha-D-glucosyltransferase / alpha-amylase